MRTFGTGSAAHRRSGWLPSMISDASVMEIPNDFRELLELFNVHKVEYLVVGGYALAFHHASRITPVRPLSPGF